MAAHPLYLFDSNMTNSRNRYPRRERIIPANAVAQSPVSSRHSLRLANNGDDPSSAIARPKGRTRKPRKIGRYCPANQILQETTTKYYIEWADDPKTGMSYPPTWEPKKYANIPLVNHWEQKKRDSLVATDSSIHGVSPPGAQEWNSSSAQNRLPGSKEIGSDMARESLSTMSDLSSGLSGSRFPGKHRTQGEAPGQTPSLAASSPITGPYEKPLSLLQTTEPEEGAKLWICRDQGENENCKRTLRPRVCRPNYAQLPQPIRAVSSPTRADLAEQLEEITHRGILGGPSNYSSNAQYRAACAAEAASQNGDDEIVDKMLDNPRVIEILKRLRNLTNESDEEKR